MASISEGFDTAIASGKYLFHLHTDYTDGSSRVEEYFEYASIMNYEAIIFTEHVRKNISYSFEDFAGDIGAAGRRYPGIKAFIGAEAKILPGGTLDMPDKILPLLQVICFACHSFPNNIDLYRESLKTLFADEKWSWYPRVWVHPGRFLERNGYLEKSVELMKDLVSLAVEQDIYVEKNLREKLSPYITLRNVPNDKIIKGYDAHSVAELKRISAMREYLIEVKE